MKKIRQSLSVALVLTLLLSAFSMLGISSVSAAGVDLTVTAVGGEASTLTIEDGTTVSSKVIASIRNTGDTATNGTVSVDFFVDNRFFETVNYANSIAAGGLALVQTSASKSFFFGSHSVRAIATYAGDTYAADNKLKNRLTVFDTTYYPPEKYDSVPLPEPAQVPAIANIQPESASGVTYGGSAGFANNHAGYTGTGFIQHLDAQGNSVTIPVTVEETGTYTLGIRYATASNYTHAGPDTSGRATITTSAGTNTTATLMMFSNAYAGEHVGPYGQTDTNTNGYWDSWRWTYVTVNLNAGSNTITIANNNWAFNVDDITLEKQLTSAEKTITSFWFYKRNNPALKGDIQCDVGDGKITAMIPANVDTSKLIATFTTKNGVPVKAKAANGDIQESDVSALNYTNGMKLYADGTEYAVVLQKTASTNLPYFFIEFTDEVKNTPLDPENGDNRLPLDMLMNSRSRADKEKYKIACIVTLDASSASLPSNLQTDSANASKLSSFQDVGSSTVKLRGNSTVTDAEKKSYTIKLGKKNAALDMGKHKTWIINGCNDDKTMMRQYFGYQLATYLNNTRSAGNWSVHMRFAQVWLDGKYLGAYMFGESIKVADTRLNIEDHDGKEEDPETGEETNVSMLARISSNTDYDHLSFWAEKDERQGNPSERDVDPQLIFTAGSGGTYNSWAINAPEDEMLDEANISSGLTQRYRECVSNYVNAAIGSFSGNYEEYIDVDSFIDFYICYEVIKTIDAGTGFSSVNFSKDVAGGINGGKMFAGPVWDFNPGAGNANYNAANNYNNDTNGFWIRSGRYFWNTLFNNNRIITTGRYAGQNKTFAQAVSARYHELYTGYLSNISTHITTLESYLAPAMNDNYTRWDSIDTYTWPQPKIFHSYAAEVNYFRTWMADRASWLNTQYGG
jgi:hypothetical protein